MLSLSTDDELFYSRSETYNQPMPKLPAKPKSLFTISSRSNSTLTSCKPAGHGISLAKVKSAAKSVAQDFTNASYIPSLVKKAPYSVQPISPQTKLSAEGQTLFSPNKQVALAQPNCLLQQPSPTLEHFTQFSNSSNKHSSFETISSTAVSEKPKQSTSATTEKAPSGTFIPHSFTPVATACEKFIYTDSSGVFESKHMLDAPDMQAFVKDLKAQLEASLDAHSAKQAVGARFSKLACKDATSQKLEKDTSTLSTPKTSCLQSMEFVSVKGARLPRYVPEEPLPRELLGEKAV